MIDAHAATAATILIVEDDAVIRQLVGEVLRNEGFSVAEAEGATQMNAILARTQPQLVILDVMLPGEDGLSICRRLHAHERCSILMLSAKAEEIDRVAGLETGADDYLVKPFGPRELIARVRALLRRGPRIQAPPTRRFSVATLKVDLDARLVVDQQNAPVALTSAEFDLFACFIERPRRVLTRDQIGKFTRGRVPDPLDRSIDMIVSRLRRKLDRANPGASLISTVRNGGYLLTALVTPTS
ncbi:MAG TPA: response regulator transcription factor [Steroidobacteraceae bacterium]|jgi:DNA-binding response OmpR family regulator